MGIGEIRRIVMAENIVNGYMARQSSNDWAAWSKDHPDLARLLELGAYLNRENHGG